MEINEFTNLCQQVNEVTTVDDGKFIADIVLGLHDSNEINDTELIIIYFLMFNGWTINEYVMAHPYLKNILKESRSIINAYIPYHSNTITPENIFKVYEELKSLL